MRYVIGIIGTFLIIALGGFLLLMDTVRAPGPVATSSPQDTATPSEPIAVVARNLEIPWDIAFLPDGSMLVTERPGRVVHIESGTRIPVDGVHHIGEGGLLGIALHPDFSRNGFVYLYQTTRTREGVENRVVRYTYADNTLTKDRIIVSDIQGAPYHDGGRIVFGPPALCEAERPGCYLWVTAGDATNADSAQDPERRAGSILRVHPDGRVPDGNPYPNGVWSYGHRNPQGLTWETEGRLWSSEHGRSGLQSGMDEINLIRRGMNYGWPEIEGDETKQGMEPPVIHSGPDVTWAPASALYWDGSIFVGGLKGEAIYEAVLDGTSVTTVRRHLHGEFGRIRSIVQGPNGMFYLTTSNRDGRGDPVEGDDRIIRLDPSRVFRE